MNEFKRAKEAYDNIPIPDELAQRVQTGIRQGKARCRNRRNRTVRRWIASAACFGALLAGLNLSPAMASAAASVPVLGGLFQVLTFVDYDKTEDGIHYSVSAPELEADGVLAEKVNAAIQCICRKPPGMLRRTRTGRTGIYAQRQFRRSGGKYHLLLLYG